MRLRALLTHIAEGWQRHVDVFDLGLGGAGIATSAPIHAEDAVSLSFVAATLFGATRDWVSDVWIGGRAAVAERRLLALDEEELLAGARRMGEQLPGAAWAWSARRAAPEG